MTNAEARFSNSLPPRKPEGSQGIRDNKVWGWETSVYSLMRLTWVLQYFSVALADALHILMTQSDVKVTLIGEERPLGGRE